ncbi:general stress protein [Indiicoccus explosivorum]|uniref:general stress protein n=1 Tax=Indiicoccus explosivorum TaxID=1917864 RepID=UPI000B454AC6|nr:general stress protein [Indiicoccus explosivorum]
MNVDKRYAGIAFSDEEAKNWIAELEKRGYAARDIHIIADDEDKFRSWERTLGVHVESDHPHESFTDKFKNFLGGREQADEGLDRLNLTEAEREKSREAIRSGGVLLYVEERDDIGREGRGPVDVAEDGDYKDRSATAPDAHISPSTNQFVNSVDNEYGQQEERYDEGETFIPTGTFNVFPILLKDVHHYSFTTGEKPLVERPRAGMSKTETRSNPEK